MWCFFFYIVPQGNELPFAWGKGCSHTALRYLRREEQISSNSTKWNERQKLTPSSISLKIFLHYDGFERPSRIVVARRLRKSTARVTPCFVGHRSKKQLSIIFCSLTGSGAPKGTNSLSLCERDVRIPLCGICVARSREALVAQNGTNCKN